MRPRRLHQLLARNRRPPSPHVILGRVRLRLPHFSFTPRDINREEESDKSTFAD